MLHDARMQVAAACMQAAATCIRPYAGCSRNHLDAYGRILKKMHVFGEML